MQQQLSFLRTLGAVEVARRLERTTGFERRLAEANEALFLRLNELARRPRPVPSCSGEMQPTAGKCGSRSAFATRD